MTDDEADASVHEPEADDAVSPPEEREFGTQGWLLVAGIVLVFVAAPLTIYVNATGIVSLPFRFTFLVLPLIPAVLLALLAVWVTTTA